MISTAKQTVRFIDLFCGIGGFRYAIEGVAEKIGVSAACVLSSDIDPDCQKAYAANFGEAVHLPLRALIDAPVKNRRPDSHDPNVYDSSSVGGWNRARQPEDYGQVVEKWRSENPRPANHGGNP